MNQYIHDVLFPSKFCLKMKTKNVDSGIYAELNIGNILKAALLPLLCLPISVPL